MIDVGIVHHSRQGGLDIFGIEFPFEVFGPQLLKLLRGESDRRRGVFCHGVFLSIRIAAVTAL
jgi:hypothetical protein